MISIAIDGPASAGKSTIAKQVAKKLGFIYVDTGALYRAIGYFVATNGGDTKEKNDILPMLLELDVQLKYENGTQKVFVNGSDVSKEIRTPEMSMNASNVSAVAEVRTFLLDLQKNLAKNNNVIMDGR
ncbi:MAG: (d)CMP kinase, partial [Oscillospiraceae bacterium]